jgi:UrcA family protein
MSMPTLSIFLAAATLAAGVGSAGASAAADHHIVSTTVRYGDLNLANPEGAQAMLTRIRHAARQVCEPAPQSALEYADWRNCVSNATNGAVSRLNEPMVTAAYSGKQTNSVVLAQSSSR